MKTWKAIKAGLTGLAVTALSYLSGCTTTGYKNAPEYLLKYNDVPAVEETAETKTKDSEPKLEKKVKKETERTNKKARSQLDVTGNDFSLIRLQRDHPFNIMLSAGGCGAWLEDTEKANSANLAAKALVKAGDARISANLQHVQATERANPDDQEDEDMHASISRMLFGTGAYTGKDPQVYGEVNVGGEHTRLSGVVDGWTQDLLIGARFTLDSKSTDLSAILDFTTTAGILDGMNAENTDKYKIEIGEDAIPVEGEYGKISGALTVQWGGLELPAIGKVYLVAKGSATYEHFERFAKFNNYQVSVGADKRVSLSDGDIEARIGLDAFAKYKQQDFVTSSSEAQREFGLLAKLQVKLSDGVYADLYGMVTREQRHGKLGHAEYEGGAQLTLIPGDILGYLTD